MGQTDGPRSPQLQRLGRRLKQWRKGHAPRARLPEEGWAAAVALAGQEGLYRAARTLRLDDASLKQRVEAAASTRGTGPRASRSRTATLRARDKKGTALSESCLRTRRFIMTQDKLSPASTPPLNALTIWFRRLSVVKAQ